MAKQEPFPRSIPYRAPDAHHPAASAPLAPAAPRASILLLGGICVLFLAGGLGIGILTANRGGKREDPSADRGKDAVPPGGRLAQRGDSPAAPPESSKKDVPPESSKKDVLPAPPLRELEIPKKETLPAEGLGLPLSGGKMTSQPGTPTAIPETVVEALGGLTASHLYQTYLNIGLLADSAEGEVYEKDEARRLLDTVAGLMTAVEQQLDRVGRQPLKGDEKKSIEQARQITASLRTQTRELQSYWDKGDKDHAARFHQARQDSWTGIKALLNIQE